MISNRYATNSPRDPKAMLYEKGLYSAARLVDWWGVGPLNFPACMGWSGWRLGGGHFREAVDTSKSLFEMFPKFDPSQYLKGYEARWANCRICCSLSEGRASRGQFLSIHKRYSRIVSQGMRLNSPCLYPWVLPRVLPLACIPKYAPLIWWQSASTNARPCLCKFMSTLYMYQT